MKMQTFSGVAAVLGVFVLIWSPVAPKANGQSLENRISADIGALYGGDDQERAKATRDLVEIGKPSIPSLLKVLDDDRRSDFDRAYRSAATALGDLKASEAAPRLAWLLGTGDSATVIMEGRSDESLAAIDPAFEPLVKIGDPAVPELKKELSVGNWNKRYLILRILRSVGTPDSLALGRAYVGTIESELRIAKKLFPEGKPAT
jgi:HEAT repeat protein